MDDVDEGFSPRTLLFKDAARERAFLQSRHKRLTSKVFIWLCLLTLYVLGALTAVAVGGWSTNGGVFEDSAQGSRVALSRNIIYFAVVFFTATWMLVAKASSPLPTLSPRGFELFTAGMAVFASVLCTIQIPWYLAKLHGVDPRAVIAKDYCSDEILMLLLDIWLTGFHLMLPLRWVVLWPLELAAFLCYAVPAIALGSRMDTHFVGLNMLLMALLIVAAALGKRALEHYERSLFVLVVSERTKRAEAEHKLCQSQVPEAATPDPCSRSDVTGSIFEALHVGEAGTVKERLEQVAGIGRQEHWLVESSDLRPQPGRVLGNGGYGIAVVAGYHGTEVVLKVPRTKKDAEEANKALPVMAQELRILRRLRHPCIVLFYGACVDPGNAEIVLVLEYVRGADIAKVVAELQPPPLDMDLRRSLLDDVCCALCYLHAQKPAIVHGDIKDSNILVEEIDRHRRAKLLDFGLSRLLTPGARRLGGTLKWMAPEVIVRKGKEGVMETGADVFSLGRLAYTVMTGQRPLREVEREEIITAARQGSCPPLSWPDPASSYLASRALCEVCTEFEPSRRPSAVDVQSMLRRWSSLTARGATPAAGTCKHAAPPHAQAGQDLMSAISEIRSLPAGQVAKKGKSEAAASRAPLMWPSLKETPDIWRSNSIFQSLLSWNVPVSSDACCRYHALLGELQLVVSRMQSQACNHIDATPFDQCPQCKLICISGEASDGYVECRMCGHGEGCRSETAPASTFPDRLEL